MVPPLARTFWPVIPRASSERIVAGRGLGRKEDRRLLLLIEGAQLLAVAIALALCPGPLDRKAFYQELRRRAGSEEFRWALGAAARLRRGDTISFLGSSLEAHRSVVTAIACFTASPRSYEDAVARAIGLGDDTDTLAAMTGALVGAHLGVAAVPGRLLDRLEDGVKGRSHIASLAARLHERHVSWAGA